MLAGTAAAYVLALTWHYPELGVLSACGGLALIFSALWMAWRPAVQVHRTIESTRVERGQAALASLTLHNMAAHSLVSSLVTERCGPQTLLLDTLRIAGRSTRKLVYALPTEQRALLPIGPARLLRQDPLGLFRRTTTIVDEQQLCVCPISHRLVGLPFGAIRSMDGPDAARLPHGSITFHALRDYVFGDDLRHVHWKASARFGSLMVRENVDTSIANLTIVLDTQRASLSPSLFEAALEGVASVVSIATRLQYPVLMLTSDGKRAFMGGARRSPDMLLELLASVEQSDEAPLLASLARLALGTHRDLLFVVSGATSPQRLAAINAQAQRFHRSVVSLFEPAGDKQYLVGPKNGWLIQAASGQAFATAWNRAVGR